MIEHSLRRQLEPIVTRRRRLDLLWRLSLYWLITALTGLALIGAAWLWGWRLSFALGLWGVAVVVATIVAFWRCERVGPDYQAIARDIERHHPDLRALLLAAIELKPQSPGGRLGYLQTQVLREAVVHATNHDWLESIPPRTVALAHAGWIAALLLLVAVFSQMLPSISLLPQGRRGILAFGGYDVTITPGDTTVEAGSPVVIVAQFDGQVPSDVSLSYGAAGQAQQQVLLTRSVDDAVFGGVIQDVRSDLLYHVEYDGRRSSNYRIHVYDRPRLVRADAKIVFPAYTNLPEKTIHDTRQISVVEGSRITLTFTLNKPVATARLAPRTGIALALSADAEVPNILTTSFTAEKSERYELLVADAQGLENEFPPRFAIDVHKNLPPEVKPVFPNRDVAASALEELDLQAEVSDDYGVLSYGLTYALVGADSREIALNDSSTANKQRLQYLLALEELGAVPDQLLTYYFWADDVGPDGMPRRTASDIYFAEIRPFDEVFVESQSFQDQRSQRQQNQDGQPQSRQTEELIQMQKQIIIATWNIKQQTDLSGNLGERAADLDVVRQSQADALERAQSALAKAEDPSAGQTLQAAAEHMTDAVNHLTLADAKHVSPLLDALDAEQAAYQELLKLRQREHQVARGQSSDRSSDRGSARSQQQLQQLQLTEQENRYETERRAQSQRQTAQREDLQVLNRLGDLARRQNDMSERLREAEAALRQARSEQERQEILRELRRLRDEQLETLRDVDELQARMDQDQSRQRTADTRQQLDDSRSQIQQSAQELEEGRVSQAITSATRAQRQLEEMRDEFRRNTSSRFSEEMRDMRDRAQQLDRQQDRIAERMEQQQGTGRRMLADNDTAGGNLTEQVQQQRREIEELIEQMRDVSDQAEVAEPLLSRRLYDTLRRASTENLDRALEATGQLLERNFLPEAQEIERRAARGIRELREGVEEAAESVLGDEAESLRLARQQLDELIEQIDEEAARAGRLSQADPAGDDDTGQRPGVARDAERPQDEDARTAQGGASSDRWSDDARGPLTGGDYRQWSDRLRDVEEMLTERDLREDVARVRDRARTVRTEFVRHGKEPQWDLVAQQIMKPLAELRERLTDRLAQLQSDTALVPIDRDPVPDRFAELVRSYFESLGGEAR